MFCVKDVWSGHILNDLFNRLFLFHFNNQLFLYLFSGNLTRQMLNRTSFHWQLETFVNFHTSSYQPVFRHLLKSCTSSLEYLEAFWRLQIIWNEHKMPLACFNDKLRQRTCIKIHIVHRDISTNIQYTKMQMARNPSSNI